MLWNIHDKREGLDCLGSINLPLLFLNSAHFYLPLLFLFLLFFLLFFFLFSSILSPYLLLMSLRYVTFISIPPSDIRFYHLPLPPLLHSPILFYPAFFGVTACLSSCHTLSTSLVSPHCRFVLSLPSLFPDCLRFYFLILYPSSTHYPLPLPLPLPIKYHDSLTLLST